MLTEISELLVGGSHFVGEGLPSYADHFAEPIMKNGTF